LNGEGDRRETATRDGLRVALAITLATFQLALTLALLPTVPATARTPVYAHISCEHRGGPGIIGTEALINVGWTTGETDKLVSLLSDFSHRVCPQPAFLDIASKSIYQKHVDHDTVWQYTFRILSDPKHHYLVTAQFPDLLHMRVIVRSSSGRVLYRSGTVKNE
jgi:hypothetical protein